tara:strand:+ start:6006 stop:7379 length:1374 start_codon:yes stop_codon:yes gene_type:complete
MANTLGVKVGNQDNRVFTGWDFGDEASKTADSLLALVDKDKDRKTRAKELADSRAFTTSERIAGEKFTEKEAEKSRQLEIKKIKTTTEGAKEIEGKKQEGRVQLTNMSTKARLDIEKYIQGELGKRLDKQNIHSLMQIGARGNIEKELRSIIEAGLDKRNIANNDARKDIVETQLAGAMEQLTKNLDSQEFQQKRMLDMKSILADKQLTHEQQIEKMRILSREGISKDSLAMQKIISDDTLGNRLKIAKLQELNKVTIATMDNRNKLDAIAADIKGKSDLSKQEYEQRVELNKDAIDNRVELLSRTIGLQPAQDKVIAEKQADKTFAFKPSDYNALYEEKGGWLGVGFNESDILDEYYGNAEEEKPGLFGSIHSAVTGVMQTSPNNPKRQEVLTALVKMRDRFKDKRFYGVGDAIAGTDIKAKGALEDIEGLIGKLANPMGVQGIPLNVPQTYQKFD